MRPEIVLRYEFVDFIPEQIEEETVYVCIPFATVAHRCCCGCGHEVVTPLSPTDWKLIFDGVSVSLHPSIGNWNLPCQSHYWIQQNRVFWAGRWSQEQIEAARAADALAKTRFFGGDATRLTPTASVSDVATRPDVPAGARTVETKAAKATWWRSLLGWLFGQ